MKNCSNKSCKQQNPQQLHEFSKNNTAPDKLQWWCKKCQKERRETPEYKQKERERAKTPKRREKLKKWRATPSAIQRRKELTNTIEYKEVAKKRREIPEIKQAVKERSKTAKYKRISRGQQLKKFWPNCNGEQALANFDQLFAQQNGCCAICNRHQSEFEKSLEVDHCHKTGKVRGLLCHFHNKAIGLFQDNLILLDNAKDYLIKNS